MRRTPGEQLRRLRTNVGWSLSEAGSRWGLSSCTVSRIERDLVLPDAAVAVRMERDLGLAYKLWVLSPLVIAIAGVAT